MSKSFLTNLLTPDVGVFAGEKMEAGTFLGIYSGELITEAIGEYRRFVFQRFATYCADNKWFLVCTMSTVEHTSLTYKGTTMWLMPSTLETYVIWFPS